MNKKYYVWIQYALYVALSMVALMFMNLFYALLEPKNIHPVAVFSIMMILLVGLGWWIVILYKFIMIKLFGEEARI